MLLKPLLIYLGLFYIAVLIANRKKIDTAWIVLISIFLTPIIGIIIALAGDRKDRDVL